MAQHQVKVLSSGLGVLNKLGVTPAEAGVHPEVFPHAQMEQSSQDGFRPLPE